MWRGRLENPPILISGLSPDREQMPFQIHPIKEFLVRPALPGALARLNEIAYNLFWSWDHTLRSLFRRPRSGSLEELRRKPGPAARPHPAGRFGKGRGGPAVSGSVPARRAHCTTRYIQAEPPRRGEMIAYFSMEYGLIDCMPIYSGGLGILSGDHLKSSSDAGLPLVAVGLLYQKGYLQQILNPDGWQQERNPVNDFYTLPVRPVKTDRRVAISWCPVNLPTGPFTSRSGTSMSAV